MVEANIYNNFITVGKVHQERIQLLLLYSFESRDNKYVFNSKYKLLIDIIPNISYQINNITPEARCW